MGDATSRQGEMMPPEQEPDTEHGRIGYGWYGRWTPLALAALLIAALGLIGLSHAQSGPPQPTDRIGSGKLAGQPAPDVTLTLLDGSSVRLRDLRGSVVVLNFWASWCGPCKLEAPELQAVAQEGRAAAERLIIVGVGLKDDDDAAARAFVADHGLTYPIGRDTAGNDPNHGPIELAFGIDPYYPTTVFIRSDGTVDRVHVGQLNAELIREAVAAAR